MAIAEPGKAGSRHRPSYRARTYFVIGVVVAALALAWLAISITIASSARRGRPDIAIWFDHDQSFALARLANNVQLADPTRRGMIAGETFAHQALERDPTHAIAVRALGFAADSRGQTERAAKLLRFASRLSKRDLLTQLWLIEYNVKRGDVPAVLQHFDPAISTSPEAMPTLFPILINALSDAQLVRPIAKMLDRQPWWLPSFLNQTALQAPSTSNAAALFLVLAKSGHPIRRDIVTTLAQRLRAQGHNADADRLTREASMPGPPGLI